MVISNISYAVSSSSFINDLVPACRVLRQRTMPLVSERLQETGWVNVTRVGQSSRS